MIVDVFLSATLSLTSKLVINSVSKYTCLYMKTLMMMILYDEIIDDDIFYTVNIFVTCQCINVRKYYIASFRFKSPLQFN